MVENGEKKTKNRWHEMEVMKTLNNGDYWLADSHASIQSLYTSTGSDKSEINAKCHLKKKKNVFTTKNILIHNSSIYIFMYS